MNEPPDRSRGTGLAREGDSRRVLEQWVPGSRSSQEALNQSAALLAGALSDEYRIRVRHPSRATRDETGTREETSGDAGMCALVHYVGYGYSRRGAPLWLAREVERFVAGGPRRKLLVQFHEVAAFGPPWRSSFWLAPLQRRVAARLARLATGAVTSLERYAELLHRLAPALHLEVLPVFSPIAEPSRMVPWNERERALVLFGSPETRRTIWSRHARGIERTMTSLELERIVEIGSEPAGPSSFCGRPVERTGLLESERVGETMARSRAAYFGYPLEYLSKSGAFAAACAHGMLAVCEGRSDPGRVAPGEGERWVAAAAIAGYRDTDLMRIAGSARQWYGGHDLRRHARTWSEYLRS